jgi:hypothetical protein
VAVCRDSRGLIRNILYLGFFWKVSMTQVFLEVSAYMCSCTNVCGFKKKSVKMHETPKYITIGCKDILIHLLFEEKFKNNH